MILLAVLAAALFVIDGDTFRDGATKYRLADVDTPEIEHAQCPDERARGLLARNRVEGLIAGADAVTPIPTGEIDKYGRVLARIEIDGQDLGALLVAERLAKPWPRGRGPKPGWC